jgi:hypothetical protein
VPIYRHISQRVLDTALYNTIIRTFSDWYSGPEPKSSSNIHLPEVTYVYSRRIFWVCEKFYFSLATVLLKLKINVIVDTAQRNLVARSPCSWETHLQCYIVSHVKIMCFKSVLCCKGLNVNLSRCQKKIWMIHNRALGNYTWYQNQKRHISVRKY